MKIRMISTRQRLSHRLLLFFSNERGLSSAEYVIAGGVILVVLGSLFASLLSQTSGEMSDITSSIPSD